jgi:hypothetical protein
MQLQSIVGFKDAMEKSKDLIDDSHLKQYLIKLKDHGIKVGEDEDPIIIGKKMLENTQKFSIEESLNP